MKDRIINRLSYTTSRSSRMLFPALPMSDPQLALGTTSRNATWPPEPSFTLDEPRMSCRPTDTILWLITQGFHFTVHGIMQFLEELLSNFPQQDFVQQFPDFCKKTLTFPWHMYNSLTFLGFPDKWSLCKMYRICS